jgi:hypothetical protein
MRFVSEAEARSRAQPFASGADSGHPLVPAPGHATLTFRFEHLQGYRYFALAQEIVRSLEYFDWCLLWVTAYGTWPSNENLHLYYRIRSSYGDLRLMEERPAIVVLRHETVDLASFVHLGVLFGWEMYLVTSHDYGRAFISRDGWTTLSEQSLDVIKTIEKRLGPKS